MGTPTQRHPSRRKGNRRVHQTLTKLQVTVDADGHAARPHQASPTSGTYKGRQVIDVEKRRVRRLRKVKKIS